MSKTMPGEFDVRLVQTQEVEIERSVRARIKAHGNIDVTALIARRDALSSAVDVVVAGGMPIADLKAGFRSATPYTGPAVPLVAIGLEVHAGAAVDFVTVTVSRCLEEIDIYEVEPRPVPYTVRAFDHQDIIDQTRVDLA